MVGYYILALCAFASLAVGVLVAAQSITNRRNQLFILLTFVFILLSTANAFSLDTHLDQFFFIRAVMFASTSAVFLIYLLIRAIRSVKLLPNAFAWFMAIFTLAVALLDWTPIIFTGYEVASPPRPIPGPGAVLFVIHFVIAVAMSISTLRKGMKSAQPNVRQQYRYMLYGLLPILVFAPITSFILPLVFNITGLIIISPLYTFIFIAFVGYAIARHGLFDIKQAAVRTTAYAFSLTVLAAIYYVLAYVASVIFFGGDVNSSVSINPVNILLALLLAFMFQPIKLFFDRVTDKVFFHDRYDPNDFFARLSELLAAAPDLSTLLQGAAHEIGATLKSEQTFFFVRYNHVHHVCIGTAHHKNLPVYDVDILDQYVAEEGSEVVATDLLPEHSHVRRLLISHRITLLLPLMHDGKTIGYLALGDHLSGNYTSRDTKVLATIADELVIAIQNALSVQEVKDINDNLKQRIDAATAELRTTNERLRRIDATKDEFLSMASHQLRTPLTSVKGYISMLLGGDAGKVSASQAKLLGEAFASSERMVHLINDFLNVSRLQTGKFMLEKQGASLVDIVNDEVKGLQPTARSRGIKLHVDTSKAPQGDLHIDEAKIRQVVMNFIDNALYYSHDGDTIDVNVRQTDDNVEVVVKDTGIGVPKAEQSKLFTKFFRATNARRHRPDGTGVGLFLTKKVIDAHHGSIIFKSVEGKGSTFGFTLPLRENKAK